MRKTYAAILGVLLTGLLLAGCGPMTFVVGMSPGDQQQQQTVVQQEGGWFPDKVAIIDVSGMIYNMNRPGLLSEGENPVSVLSERLQACRTDPQVKAVILRINSPGGTVTASDAMYREVRRFKAQTKKPVIVLMMDVAASGGYYLACSGDKIIAYPTTITGSIGVIIQTLSVKDGLSRIGVHAEALTSGPNKDVGSPLAVLTPEHREVLMHLVHDFYGRFLDVAKAARPNIPADRWATLADGRVMSGADAEKAGLVDGLGDLQDAFAAAKAAAGIEAADLVLFHKPLDYVGSPYASVSAGAGGTRAGAAAGGGTQINLLHFDSMPELLAGTSVGAYYLWEPGVQ